MSSKYSVSVVVPVYNVEQYLDRCLDSLVNQALQNIEIIVVNDGSTDGSAEIIKKYDSRYDNIVVINQENGGLSSARNAGIDVARGDYIGFVDADDYVEKDMFRLLYDATQANSADVAICGYYRNDLKNNVQKIPALNIDAPYNRRHDSDYFIFDLSPYAWNKIFNREMVISSGIRFPEGRVYEDIPTVFPWMSKANLITVVDTPLYHYGVNRDGSIMANSHINCVSMIDSLQSINEYFLPNDIGDEGKQKLCALNIRHILRRLYEFNSFKDRKIKLIFVDTAFELLDTYFPNWRENQYFDRYGSSLAGRVKRWLMTKHAFWRLYILCRG